MVRFAVFFAGCSAVLLIRFFGAGDTARAAGTLSTHVHELRELLARFRYRAEEDPLSRAA